MLFNFSDRYSIFDWGQMPDLIPQKGASLAYSAALLMEHLENQHKVKTAFIKQVNDELGPSAKGANLVVKKFKVIKPTKLTQDEISSAYDYSHYQQNPLGALIPLEVIFVLAFLWEIVLSKGQKRPSTFKGPWLKKSPLENEFLDSPLVEFSTKLEPTDRYLNLEQVKKITGFNEDKIRALQKIKPSRSQTP